MVRLGRRTGPSRGESTTAIAIFLLSCIVDCSKFVQHFKPLTYVVVRVWSFPDTAEFAVVSAQKGSWQISPTQVLHNGLIAT